MCNDYVHVWKYRQHVLYLFINNYNYVHVATMYWLAIHFSVDIVVFIIGFVTSCSIASVSLWDIDGKFRLKVTSAFNLNVGKETAVSYQLHSLHS